MKLKESEYYCMGTITCGMSNDKSGYTDSDGYDFANSGNTTLFM